MYKAVFEVLYSASETKAVVPHHLMTLSLLAMAITFPLLSNAHLLAAFGPVSMVKNSVTLRVSHNLTMPLESTEATNVP